MKNECYNVKMLECYNGVYGFTLIELLVSINIIIVVVLSALGIYIYSIGPQQKITATADLQQDSQLIMNMIAKDIRANQIDYAEYGCGISQPIGRLYLTDGATSATYTYYICCNGDQFCSVGGDVGVLKRCEGTNCKTVSCTNSSYQQISMTDVKITLFNLYVQPACDPFDPNSEAQYHYRNPQVTVVLELKSYKEKIGERKVKLQETIPQRYQEKRYY